MLQKADLGQNPEEPRAWIVGGSLMLAITTADALMQSEYKKKLRQLGAQTKESIDEGAVTAGHLSSVQESWGAYREAWVGFARLRYPAAVAAIRAEITLDRYRLPKSIG